MTVTVDNPQERKQVHVVPASADTRLSKVRVIALLGSHEVFGKERANIEVFKTLRGQGAQVKVGVTARFNGGDVRKQVEMLGFETFAMPFGCQWSKTFFRRHPSLLPDNLSKVFRCCRVLARQVREWRATHVHLANPMVYSFIAPYLRWNRSLNLVYRAGDSPPLDSRPNLIIWRSLAERADQIVAISRFIRSRVQGARKHSEGEVSVIYNTAPSLQGLSPAEPATISLEEGRTTRPDADQPLRLLYVGQISKHKGVVELIDACAQLLAQGADLRLSLVGGSMYTKEFEDSQKQRVSDLGLSEHIQFHGYVTDPAKFYQL
ncbi:MAG: glycosyltransferase, partial [Planctomycetota bacterium]